MWFSHILLSYTSTSFLSSFLSFLSLSLSVLSQQTFTGIFFSLLFAPIFDLRGIALCGLELLWDEDAACRGGPKRCPSLGTVITCKAKPSDVDLSKYSKMEMG